MPDADRWRSRWNEAWHKAGAGSPGDETYRRLLERYQEPFRAYHNLEHIHDCLLQMDAARHLLRRPPETELAIWFHDAIYDPRGSDNEELSARLAEAELRAAEVNETVARRIGDLIRVTAHANEVLMGDAAVLCDVDLTILGAEPEHFERYDAAIRREYDWVPDVAYRRGRTKVLARFLARPYIYFTLFFQERFEAQARVNLSRAIERYRA